MVALVDDTEDGPRPASFQQFLIHQRAQLDPAALGYPPPAGRGRKPPRNSHGHHGLTQPQAARECGMTSVVYARLERGDIEPTDDHLEALATGLRLDDAKRDELYAKAGREPRVPQDAPQAIPPHQLWLELIPHIGRGQPDAPISIVTDASWEILAWNDAFVELFPEGKTPTNLITWMLWDGRDQMIDFEGSWCGQVLAQLDQALTRHPGNKRLQALMRRAKGDPICRKFLEENKHMNYMHPDGDHRPVVHARSGERGMLSVAGAEPQGAPGSRFLLVKFTPEQDWPGPLERES